MKRTLIIFLLSLIITFAIADWYESYYWIEGTAFNHDKILSNDTVEIYTCKSRNCRIVVTTNKVGQFKTKIPITGMCMSGGSYNSKVCKDKSGLECYLELSKTCNLDSLQFLYKGSLVKIENEAIRLLREQRQVNKSPTEFTKEVIIKFNSR